MAHFLSYIPHIQNIPVWNLMLKTRPLCTGVESNLGDRVLGEAEKNSFIALPGKGWVSRLMLSELCPSRIGGIVPVVLYILWIQVLAWIYDLRVIFQSVACLFIFSVMSSEAYKFFILMKSNWSVFFYYLCFKGHF